MEVIKKGRRRKEEDERRKKGSLLRSVAPPIILFLLEEQCFTILEDKCGSISTRGYTQNRDIKPWRFPSKKISKKQRYKTTNIRYFLNMYSTRTSAKNSTIKQIYREYRSNLKFRLFTSKI